MKMTDISSYSQREKDRAPRVLLFEEESTGICFKIHRHIYYPGTWLLSCDGVCDKENLRTDDFEEAKKKAFQKIKELVQGKVNLLKKFANEIEKYQSKNDCLADSSAPDPDWIFCADALPEEEVNPITKDFYQYPVTVQIGDVRDVRYLKFGRGHWWHGSECWDEYVFAWKERQKPLQVSVIEKIKGEKR